ncbi:GRAM domain-containing protein 1A-like isoform X6 [Arapaima gigas]
MFCRPGEDPVTVSELLDLGAVPPAPVGCSSPGFACGPSSTCTGSSPPSVQAVDVPLSKSSLEPEPSPPSSQSSFPSITYSVQTGGTSTNPEEIVDSHSDSTNHVLPPMPPNLGNLSSLDITNDEELPTDLSNSSDTQEESEVESFCTDLSGRLHINTVVHMSVDKLHELLFADTHFLQHLFSQRHFTDLNVKGWQQDVTSGNTSRVLSYTIAINNPLGPKTAPVVETQTLHKSSARGECYVVDSEVITSGIPYQDYFYTVHRYCLTSVNRHKSRLRYETLKVQLPRMCPLGDLACSRCHDFSARVSSDICYRKQPWSLVKALIEKNTWSGIEEYYQHMEMEVCKLETLLQSEVSVVGAGDTTAAEAAKTPPGLRRRKRNCSRRAGEREREGVGSGDRGDRGPGEHREQQETGAQYLKLEERSRGRGNISTVLLIVSFILVVLVALNMLLFYKLWSLERAAHTLETWHSYSLADSPLPQTAGEWAQVLQMQRQFHQAQLNKWQQILQSSVALLDQMKQSLEKLHRRIIVPEVQQSHQPEAPEVTLT